MSAAIVRQWFLLSILPKPPRRIDTASIEFQLRARGILVARRTIQRDLIELARVFPIVSDERSKPYGWRWSDDAEFPSHNLATRAMGTSPASGSLEVRLRVPRADLAVVLARLRAREVRASDDRHNSPNVTVTVLLEDTAGTRRVLLGHGGQIEVVDPRALRIDIAGRARRALEAHVD